MRLILLSKGSMMQELKEEQSNGTVKTDFVKEKKKLTNSR